MNTFDKEVCDGLGVKELVRAKKDIMVQVIPRVIPASALNDPTDYVVIQKGNIVGLLHEYEDVKGRWETSAYVSNGNYYHLVQIPIEHFKPYKERE